MKTFVRLRCRASAKSPPRDLASPAFRAILLTVDSKAATPSLLVRARQLPDHMHMATAPVQPCPGLGSPAVLNRCTGHAKSAISTRGGVAKVVCLSKAVSADRVTMHGCGCTQAGSMPLARYMAHLEGCVHCAVSCTGPSIYQHIRRYKGQIKSVEEETTIQVRTMYH